MIGGDTKSRAVDKVVRDIGCAGETGNEAADDVGEGRAMMRWISVGERGRERPAVRTHTGVAVVGMIGPEWHGSWRSILQRSEAAGESFDALFARVRTAVETAEALGGGAWIEDASERWGPPIPDPSKIVAIGLNYRDHAEEQNKQPPERPLLFPKAPTSLIGPHDAIVPPPPDVEDRVDAEAELCAVVGRTLRYASPDEGNAALVGVTIMNDVSGRRAQYSDKQWFRGKSFDTFAPCGPWIVTVDELTRTDGLALEADWNERPMQRGNTRDLLFDVPQLLSYISMSMTLLPGDLVSTGTPSGVGVFRDPQVFLKDGDVVTIRLEGVGELSNRIEMPA